MDGTSALSTHHIEGYRKRFHIVYRDYRTQRRFIKDRARWYSETIGRNRPAGPAR